MSFEHIDINDESGLAGRTRELFDWLEMSRKPINRTVEEIEAFAGIIWPAMFKSELCDDAPLPLTGR